MKDRKLFDAGPGGDGSGLAGGEMVFSPGDFPVFFQESGFDEKVVGTVLKGLASFGDYRVMVASDHLTPISKKTHSGEPTPFAWASRRDLESAPRDFQFSEKCAAQSGLLLEEGHRLMPMFLGSMLRLAEP